MSAHLQTDLQNLKKRGALLLTLSEEDLSWILRTVAHICCYHNIPPEDLAKALKKSKKSKEEP